MAGKSTGRAKALPKTIGGCLQRLAVLQEQLEELDARRSPIAEEETRIRDYMFESFKKDELSGAKGSGLQCSLAETTVPTLVDFKKFLSYAMKKGNEDLLQKSVNTPAWRERLEAGKKVPGVDSFKRVSLRVGKVRGAE